MNAAPGRRWAPTSRISRRWSLTLWSLVTALLVSGIGAAYLRQGTTTVTVDDAVAAFRAGADPTVTTTTAATPAAPSTTDAASATPDDGPTTATPPSTAPAAAAAGAGAASVQASSQARAAGPAAAPGSAPQSSASPAADTGVEDGVYRFATEGYEATNALGGSRHDYPSETPVTIRHTECGWSQRWQPLDERWDESLLCPGDGGAVDFRRFTTYHEFFQRSQQQQFDCPPGAAVFRSNAAPGTSWTWRCEGGGSAIDTVVTVAGPESITIEGQDISATRIRYESKMSGGNRGTQTQDRWIRDDGLNLRIKTDIDTEADSPFGPVHYEEHYTITMSSLRPRR